MLHELSFALIVLAGLGLVALTCSKQPDCKAWPVQEDACGVWAYHATCCNEETKNEPKHA